MRISKKNMLFIVPNKFIRKIVVVLIMCHLSIVVSTLAYANTFNYADRSNNQQATTINIKGNVVDESGEPIIGATVVEVGKQSGTITDINGDFSYVVDPSGSIIVSYMGFQSQKIQIKQQTSFSIILLEDSKALEEVVIVGFGQQRKVNVTGAVGVATSKELEARPVANITQSLQGVVPGLGIFKNNGSMDKGTTIRIRGVGTISGAASDAPLVLIDGVESDINAVNPADVDNISVLKDAGSAAIYGSKGANGVILITTKTGKAGKTKINYTNNYRWDAPVSRPRMMDSYSFVNFFNEAKRNTSGNLSDFSYPEETLQNILDYRNGLIDGPLALPLSGNSWGANLPGNYSQGQLAYADTDWYEVMYKNWAYSQEHNASFSGGNENFTYFFSANYMDQSALLKVAEEGMKRYSVNGKFSSQLSKSLKLNYSSRFVRYEYTRPNALGDGLYENLARQGRANLPLYDNNGYIYGAFDLRNIIEGGRYTRKTDYNTQQFTLIFEPIKDWITTGDINYRVVNGSTYAFALPTYGHGVDGSVIDNKPSSSISESYSQDNYVNGSIRTRYTFMIDDKHNISAMTGFQFEDLRQEQGSTKAYGILNLNSPQINATSDLAGDGTERPREATGSSASWATAGFFTRINYDYLDKYLLEFNARYDGSSRFRADSRWKLYPSISAGWKLIEEDFMQGFKSVVDILKLRGSWGSLGNQNTSGWYPTYQTMGLAGKNQSGAGAWLQDGEKPAIASYPAPITSTLTWQTNTTINGGIDLGLFRNRLSGSFDIFKRETTNMIGPAEQLPAIFGQSVPRPNNTSLKTNGFEIELAWRDQLSNGFKYEIKATLADAKTVITHYPNDKNTLGEWWRSGVSYRTGLELGEMWGYETIGIAKTQEEMEAHLDQLDENYKSTYGEYPNTLRNGQSFGSNWGAGDIMYKDVNGDGIISAGDGTLENHGDIKVIGNNQPHYFYGIDLNASWKGLDLRVFLQGVMKRDFFMNSFTFWGAYTNEAFSTAFVDHLDYFRAEDTQSIFGANVNSYYPRPTFDSEGILGRNHMPQTRYLLNASYIRLKNIQLGYTIPEKLTNKFYISNLRFYVSGENLWTGTNLTKIFDPETIDGGKGGDTDWRNVNNGNAYPLSKVVSCGMSLSF